MLGSRVFPRFLFREGTSCLAGPMGGGSEIVERHACPAYPVLTTGS